MKKFFLIFAINLLTQLTLIAGVRWQWQNPIPSGNEPATVKFYDENTGIIAGWNRLILKTTDGGIHWNVVSSLADPLVALTCVSLANSVVYYAAGFDLDNSIRTAELLKSVDAGLTWSCVSITPPSPNTGSYIQKINFQDENTGLVLGTYFNPSSKSFLYKTTNGGVNWNNISEPGNYYWDLKFFPLTGTGYLAGSNGKIAKTTNGGNNWTVINTGSMQPYFGLDFINENTGWVGSLNQVRKTTDGGFNWSTYNNPEINALKIQFKDALTGYTAGSNKISKTTNGGQNFSVTRNGPSGALYDFDLLFISDKVEAVGGGQTREIIKSSNGGINWSNLLTGPIDELHSIDFKNSQTGFSCGEKGLTMRTTNGGNTWSEDRIGVQNFDRIKYDPYNSHVWLTSDSQVYKSTDDGITYHIVPGINPNGQVTDVKFLTNNHSIITVDYSKVFTSSDGGSNWNERNLPQGTVVQEFLPVGNNGIGYGAGSKEVMDRSVIKSCVLKTTNFGETWSEVLGEIYPPLTGGYFFNKDTGIVVGWSGTALKTTNGGNSWQLLNTGADSLNTHLAVKFYSQHSGYILNSTGLFFSSNQGQSWTKFPLPSSQGLGMHVADSLNMWIAGRWGTIIKTSTGGFPIGVNVTGTNIPDKFELFQNYPNPFNPYTKIKFNISDHGGKLPGSYVRLAIYDVLGRQVKLLVNEMLKPGSYEVEWNAAGMSCGIYFYSLWAEGYSHTKKAMLLN